MNEYLTVTDAAKFLPGRPHRNTARRYMLRGIDGIKLRSIKLGATGNRFTKPEWIEEFVAAVAAQQSDNDAHAEAQAKLDAMGVAS